MGKKITKMKKNLGKLPYLAQKLFLVLISNSNVRLYKLGCNCMTAILTVTEAMLKDPRYIYRQNKRFFKILQGKLLEI